MNLDNLYEKKYKQVLEEQHLKFYSYIEGAYDVEGEERDKILREKGWKFVKTADEGVRVFKKSVKTSSFVMFMTDVFIPESTPMEYFEFCHEVFDRQDNDEIHRRNDLNKQFEIVKRYTKQSTLEFCRAYTGSAFVADREFAYFRDWKLWNNHPKNLITVFLNSLDDEDDHLVEKKESVRGKNYYSDFFFTEGNGVRFVTIIHTNPMGWMSSFLYNALASGTIVKSAINPKRIFLQMKKK